MKGGEDFFHFSFVPNIFPSSSQWVPNAFPIAPRFHPICFAQSPPLLTYIGGPKGKALYLFTESFILGNLHNFNFFFIAMGQSNWLVAKK